MDINDQSKARDDNQKQNEDKSSLGNVDLQKFSSSFDKWYASTLSLLKTNTDLTNELDLQRTANKSLNEKMKSLTTENQKMQDSLNSLYCKMYVYCDLEEEIVALREKIKTKDEENLHIVEKMRQLQESYNEKEKSLQQDYKNQMEALRMELSETLENTTKHHDEMIQKKVLELEDLDKVLKKRDADHNAEVTRLSMEWEDKISELKQRLQQQQTKPSCSSNQEIFRMKFLNLKQEYDGEMRRLQQIIQTLEDRLRTRSDTTVTQTGRPSLKKRKL
ncbi:putative leucine-rich repeat-containing protein DDB_G0290503 [Saccostrea echinata]|uniref:putative leucine-rich repeat-containing protein DDB_G0290503 n=1 Tax=Saccostrea echinata TaxID=191078 RepID=UPI002A8243B4|nr:putative leucine-rich repeat-containing protein DDB_G0290503 [Saccostrea echinata]